MKRRVTPDPKGVFLNAPFDSDYEPLFVTLVATLVAAGFKPHCVLEIREHGQGRLARIYELMKGCRVSIHDLSRMGSPPRFNMPFELGLACSLKLEQPDQYDVVVFESRRFRADRSLSDYKGHDIAIHRGTCNGIISAVLETFQTNVPVAVFRDVVREMRGSAAVLKRELRSDTIFHPHLFGELLEVGVKTARDFGLALP